MILSSVEWNVRQAEQPMGPVPVRVLRGKPATTHSTGLRRCNSIQQRLGQYNSEFRRRIPWRTNSGMQGTRCLIHLSIYLSERAQVEMLVFSHSAIADIHKQPNQPIPITSMYWLPTWIFLFAVAGGQPLSVTILVVAPILCFFWFWWLGRRSSSGMGRWQVRESDAKVFGTTRFGSSLHLSQKGVQCLLSSVESLVLHSSPVLLLAAARRRHFFRLTEQKNVPEPTHGFGSLDRFHFNSTRG